MWEIVIHIYGVFDKTMLVNPKMNLKIKFVNFQFEFEKKAIGIAVRKISAKSVLDFQYE